MNHDTNEFRTQAASLTFAMLKFEQEAAHETHASDPENMRLGIDHFVFLPAWTKTKTEDVVPFLTSLTSPVLIFPTTTRGAVSLILLDELTGDRRKWGQKTLDNQVAGIDHLAEQFTPALNDDSKVMLECQGETHILSLKSFRYWGQNFSAPVGWSFGDSRNDPRAPARIRLIASDGRVNPEWTAYAPWERPVT